MTKAEMTTLFAAMSLIYRHDKMFAAGIEALKPTIEIWTAALPDMSYALGQQALMRVFRTCKYPPTPADLSEAAEEIKAEIRRYCEPIKNMIQLECSDLIGRTVEECYSKLSPNDLTRKAIDYIGGPQRLFDHIGSDYKVWNWSAFDAAYMELCLSGRPALPGSKSPALPPKKG